MVQQGRTSGLPAPPAVRPAWQGSEHPDRVNFVQETPDCRPSRHPIRPAVRMIGGIIVGFDRVRLRREMNP
jgi:hypothetical protein